MKNCYALKNQILPFFAKNEILLGTAPANLEIFNLIFIIVLKNIYAARCNDQKPNTYIIKYSIKQQFEAEKFNAKKSIAKLNRFNKKWEIIKNCFNV